MIAFFFSLFWGRMFFFDLKRDSTTVENKGNNRSSAQSMALQGYPGTSSFLMLFFFFLFAILTKNIGFTSTTTLLSSLFILKILKYFFFLSFFFFRVELFCFFLDEKVGESSSAVQVPAGPDRQQKERKHTYNTTHTHVFLRG